MKHNSTGNSLKTRSEFRRRYKSGAMEKASLNELAVSLQSMSSWQINRPSNTEGFRPVRAFQILIKPIMPFIARTGMSRGRWSDRAHLFFCRGIFSIRHCCNVSNKRFRYTCNVVTKIKRHRLMRITDCANVQIKRYNKFSKIDCERVIQKSFRDKKLCWKLFTSLKFCPAFGEREIRHTIVRVIKDYWV